MILNTDFFNYFFWEVSFPNVSGVISLLNFDCEQKREGRSGMAQKGITTEMVSKGKTEKA